MIDSRKAIWSWALYDWANSTFSTTVQAGFFPLFFKAYWANPDNPTESTFYLGLANSLASIIIAILAPLIGSIADRGTAKKKFLVTFAFLGAAMTSGLWLVHQGQWPVAVTLFIIANVGFSGANVFYDSLLPGVASERKVDSVSSLGFALGYIGGGLLFAFNVWMYLDPEFFGLSAKEQAVKFAFLTVAVWWTVFTVPLILFVKEPRLYTAVPFRKAIVLGWGQLMDTFHHIRHLKIVGLFLLAYWFYIDGVDTIVRMAVDYGISLKFSSSSLIVALLLVQFVAFPAALFYGWLGTKIGTKKAILIAIVAYCFITVGGYFMSVEWHFYLLAAMIALFQGGIQALSRSLYTRIIPEKKAAQFFGFYNMFGKFAAVLGPVLMGTITLLTGNPRLGILSIMILFFTGALLFMKVDPAQGKAMAQKYLA